jgi:protein disulfide-isomerase
LEQLSLSYFAVCPLNPTGLMITKKGTAGSQSEQQVFANRFHWLDWCGWCKKFDKEILSQSQFKDYARENLVLLEVDFPCRSRKTPN